MSAVAHALSQPVAASGWDVARRLWAYLRGSRADYAVAAAVTVGNSAVMITRPWLLHVLIDDVFGKQDRALLLPTLLGIGGLGVGLGLAAVFGHWFHTRAAEGAMSRMREDVLRQAQRMPIGDLRQRRTGDIVAHLTTDAAVVARVYLHAGSLVFAQALRLPAYLIIMTLVDWRLGPDRRGGTAAARGDGDAAQGPHAGRRPPRAGRARTSLRRIDRAGRRRARCQGLQSARLGRRTVRRGGAQPLARAGAGGAAGEPWVGRALVVLGGLHCRVGLSRQCGRRRGCGRGLAGGNRAIPPPGRGSGAQHRHRLRPATSRRGRGPPGVRLPGRAGGR